MAAAGGGTRTGVPNLPAAESGPPLPRTPPGRRQQRPWRPQAWPGGGAGWSCGAPSGGATRRRQCGAPAARAPWPSLLCGMPMPCGASEKRWSKKRRTWQPARFVRPLSEICKKKRCASAERPALMVCSGVKQLIRVCRLSTSQSCTLSVLPAMPAVWVPPGYRQCRLGGPALAFFSELPSPQMLMSPHGTPDSGPYVHLLPANVTYKATA